MIAPLPAFEMRGVGAAHRRAPAYLTTAALAIALTAAFAGCAHASASAPTTIAVGVNVTFDRRVDPLPFDPHAERLRAAAGQLEALAGHPVAFRFDAALLPEYRAAFEDLFASAIESAAKDLGYLKEREPSAFAHGAPLLEHIDCRYDAAARDVTAVLHIPSRTLRVSVPPNVYRFLEEGTVGHALVAEHERVLEERYASLAPSAVPPAEREAYFRFFTGYRAHHPRSADLSKPEGYLADPAADDIVRMIDLFGLAKATPLRAVVRKWLVERSDYFTAAYVHHPELSSAAPANSGFRRTESEWVHFLSAALPEMTNTERLAVAKSVFVRLFNGDEGRFGRFATFAFPGFDQVTFALGVVDEWRRAGHPLELPGDPDRAALYEYVVCPHPVDERGARSRAPSCQYDLYEFLLRSPAGRARLADAVLRRRDAAFTEFAVVNVGLKGEPPDLVELWRAVEPDDVTWRTVTRVIAEDFAETGGAPLLDETRRLFRTYPARRGAVLYVLSQIDRYGNGKVPWASLPASFGGGIGAADFASFLDYGRRAFGTAAVVWPALTPGFSRAAPIAERLERYLDDPLVRSYDFQDPWRALRDIVNRLCEEHAQRDLAILHSRFADRAQRKPSETQAFENLVYDTRPGACQ